MTEFLPNPDAVLQASEAGERVMNKSSGLVWNLVDGLLKLTPAVDCNTQDMLSTHSPVEERILHIVKDGGEK